MQSHDDLDWFDPEQSFYGEQWDFAWAFGRSAGRASIKQNWAEVAPTLEALWLDLGDGKSWYEARPAIYTAWRAAKLPHPDARVPAPPGGENSEGQ